MLMIEVLFFLFEICIPIAISINFIRKKRVPDLIILLICPTILLVLLLALLHSTYVAFYFSISLFYLMLLAFIEKRKNRVFGCIAIFFYIIYLNYAYLPVSNRQYLGDVYSVFRISSEMIESGNGYLLLEPYQEVSEMTIQARGLPIIKRANKRECLSMLAKSLFKVEEQHMNEQNEKTNN